MSTGWEAYYVIIISALLGLGLSLAVGLIASVLSRKFYREKKQLIKDFDSEKNEGLVNRINTRFFLGINASCVLITLGLLLIPCVGSISYLEQQGDRQIFARAIMAILAIVCFASFGLFYAVRKGDLDWVKTISIDEDQEEKE